MLTAFFRLDNHVVVDGTIKLSVILATYNWSNALSLVLASLVQQLEQYPDAELVIADDGSAEETRELITAYRKQIKQFKHVWHTDDGFRKSMILNKAVAASCGEYLLFLDGDCVPFPDYIKNHLALREPGYLVAGDRILCTESFTWELLQHPESIPALQHWSTLKWCHAKLHKKVNKCLAHLRIGLNTKPSQKWRYFAQNNWRMPKGCNFALARADFLAVNGFDETFCGWGHEDADLFVRLLHYGVHIKNGRFAIPVIHLWHKLSTRINEATNFSHLLKRVADKTIIRAQIGISQYT